MSLYFFCLFVSYSVDWPLTIQSYDYYDCPTIIVRCADCVSVVDSDFVAARSAFSCCFLAFRKCTRNCPCLNYYGFDRNRFLGPKHYPVHHTTRHTQDVVRVCLRSTSKRRSATNSN